MNGWGDFIREMERRVDAGMKYMDEHHTGWMDRVDVENLDESDQVNCVLAQVEGQLFYATELGRRPWQAEELGMFLRPTQCPDNSLGMGYKLLTDEWRRKLLKRRRKAVA